MKADGRRFPRGWRPPAPQITIHNKQTNKSRTDAGLPWNGFTTVWWFERGLKDIGGSRTLVSNWWMVNSFLGPKKLVAPEN
jgi:hypothetical protein